jgi:hypothetical protein
VGIPSPMIHISLSHLSCQWYFLYFQEESSWERQGITGFCTCQWNERNEWTLLIHCVGVKWLCEVYILPEGFCGLSQWRGMWLKILCQQREPMRCILLWIPRAAADENICEHVYFKAVLTTVKDSYPTTDSGMIAQGKLLHDVQVEAYYSQSLE